ncbi:hypothetical protein PHYBOEH_002180 [Phytophthora boehmeriae]|uniref:Rab-GAP TBC domain-containing protein n=1 Tax=Phytophthora boehmeriae TaxID=109152 RepID=A0A8T1WRK2_9STRA|nr:hypothetical protein PHYBOEH_002180 [Phytophthora boehmeriae]
MSSASDAAVDDDLFVETLQILVRNRWVQVDAVEAVAGTCRRFRDSIKRLKLRRLAVRLSGFPVVTRFRCWLHAGDVKTLMENIPDTQSSRDFYLRLAGIESLQEKASLESTGVEGEIERDVERTFPTHHLFAEDGDGRRQLGNVLKAIAVHASDVGYCQGMNYVVAAFLIMMTGDNNGAILDLNGLSVQETAFWLTISLIRRKGMADLWMDKMPGISRCIYLFQQLVKLHFYDLSVHFRHIGLHSSFLGTQWFVTLFARLLDNSTLVRVWDLFFLDGWKTVYRVALAITAQLRPKLITMDMEQCSEFFRKNPELGWGAAFSSELLDAAMQFKVTRSSLQQLEEERHLEVSLELFPYLRLRLQQTPLSDEHRILFPTLDNEGDITAQRTSLEHIRTKLRHFDSDVASDTVFLQQKIETAERAQAQALSTRYAATYALSEATFDLNERSEIKSHLRSQFRKLLEVAIAEASSSSTAGTAGPTWINPLVYINARMMSCFERLPLISSLDSTKSGGTEIDELEDSMDEEEMEAQRNLVHLEVLVPHLAADLRVLQRKLDDNERILRPLQQRFRQLQRDAQLARVEVEEAQLFKDRLADQLLQIILASEKLKNERMQQLFAEVDRG